MCGIIGVLANRPAAPIMVDALRRLEYRGYDSAGVATAADGTLATRRAVGKLDALAAVLAADPLPGFAGIGHTRWATHGEPTTANAHPHRADGVCVVHNGIIENFKALRAELQAAGRVFESATDSEVVAQLCAHNRAAGMTPLAAVQATLARLSGAFALCFLFEGEEDLIVCARRGSPLAVGYGDGEMFVGSDALALAPLSQRVSYLDEGDVAVVTRAGVEILDAAGRPAERVAAALVVLAAGAIGTPRLLLASGGLANRSRLVGRRLMMHPFGRVVGAFDVPLGSHQGHWGQSLVSMEFAETDPRRPFVRGAKWNLTPTGGPLQAALFPREGRRFGAALGRNVVEWLGRTAMWGFSVEDAPDVANRVTLADDGAGDRDDPGVAISYRPDANAGAILAFNAERARESLEASGAVKTLSLVPANDFGWHPLGTCRMGTDPETSVAGADGRAHDVNGLVLADASLFVTGSCVNPAATVAALAARVADGIVARRAS
jgi:choline dehydrogenase-like flavoprotein